MAINTVQPPCNHRAVVEYDTWRYDPGVSNMTDTVVTRTCGFSGCGRRHYALGFCEAHRAQVRRGRPLVPVSATPRRSPRSTRVRDPSGRKQCSACSGWLPEDNFHKAAQCSDGLQPVCKTCATDRRRLRQYGITRAMWNTLFDTQGRICAICGRSQPTSHDWHTDHDHETGSVRGVLCRQCNTGLGNFGDCASTLQHAILYLWQRHEAEVHFDWFTS